MARNTIEIIITAKDLTNRSLTSVAKGLTVVSKAIKITSIALLGLGAAALKSFASFEEAFAGVRKTVNATEEQFKALEDGIRDMAKVLPSTAVEISGVAEAAGQLGIQTESILGFTRTMVDLGETTNLTSREAATALARLANITQLPQDQFDELGSTIVALGNNFATTEREIVELGLRLAGTGKQIGLSESQILGMATALSSVGIRAEAGGTAFSRVFVDIANSVATGGAKLQKFAEIAGVSVDEFRSGFEDDAAPAIISFVEGLDRISESGGNVFEALEEVGFSSIRVRDTLLRASGAGDLLRQSLEVGSKAWQENTALTDEAAKRYETLTSKFNITINRIKDMGIELGGILAPAFIKVLEAVGDFSDKITLVFKNLPQVVKLVGDTIRNIFVNNFAMVGAAIIEITSRAFLAVLENFGNLLLSLGALALKSAAVLFSPLATAFDVLGQNIRFAWDILFDNLINVAVDGLLFLINKFNSLPLIPNIDTQPFDDFKTAAEETILDVPQTFSEAWKETGDDVGVIVASMTDDTSKIGTSFRAIVDDVKGSLAEFGDIPEIAALNEQLDALLTNTGATINEVVEASSQAVIENTMGTVQSLQDIWGEHFEVWLGSWDEGLQAFQELSQATFEAFKQGVGDSIASAIVFGEDLSKSLQNVLKSIAASVISALIQIGIQRLVQFVLTSQIQAKETASRMAGLSATTFAGAFSSTVAIPIIGPIIAPGVAAASTSAMLAGAAASGAAGAAVGTGIAGIAHGGLENVPEDATFFLKQGERVLAPNQNRDLTDFMDGGGNRGGVTIQEVNILPDSSIDEGLFDKPIEFWVDLVRDKILPAFNVLGDEGETTTMAQRTARI